MQLSLMSFAGCQRGERWRRAWNCSWQLDEWGGRSIRERIELCGRGEREGNLNASLSRCFYPPSSLSISSSYFALSLCASDHLITPIDFYIHRSLSLSLAIYSFFLWSSLRYLLLLLLRCLGAFTHDDDAIQSIGKSWNASRYSRVCV